MRDGGCVNKEPDILEKVESEVGSLAGTLANMDFIGPRAQQKIQSLIHWDLPKLIKEHKQLRAISFQASYGVEYEYAIQTKVFDKFSLVSDDFPFNTKTTMDLIYWADKESVEARLKWVHKEFGQKDFWLVKRRKAGKVERV